MTIDADKFKTNIFNQHPDGLKIQEILAAGINAVNPGDAVSRTLSIKDGFMIVKDQKYELRKIHRIFLVGIGKAALPMTQDAERILGNRITDGIIITKHLSAGYFGRLKVMEAGHPIPDERSQEAGRLIIQLLDGLEPDDLVLLLLSGGGSSLVTHLAPGISLEDLQTITKRLLNCGATIEEINTIRREIDQVKGGGLAKSTSPARLIGLILSDVVGDRLEAIASGPSVMNPTDSQAALDVLDKYHLLTETPRTILDKLRVANNHTKELIDFDERIQNVIIGSNSIAAEAAIQKAREFGFESRILTLDLHGEARIVSRELCNDLKNESLEFRNLSNPFCMVAGGETTVTVRGHGKGGRNQELTLAAVSELADIPDVMLISLATDGEEGFTDAAGAVVDGNTLNTGKALGMNPLDYLERNDSYNYFSKIGDLLKPGPTGTNVNDLIFLIGY